MENIVMGLLVICAIATSVILAVLCKKAYLAGWKFSGGLDNVVAPPPPMLSSGQTNPHVSIKTPEPNNIPYDFSGAGIMANCAHVVGYMNPYRHGGKFNPIYTKPVQDENEQRR